jgi:hypothetical protein
MELYVVVLMLIGCCEELLLAESRDYFFKFCGFSVLVF